MQMQKFENGEFCLEALVDYKTFYFKAKDVATALGYSNTKKAVIDHVSEKYKKTFSQLQGSRFVTLHPDTIFVSEPGFYELIFSSKLDSAVKFREWVFEEVLPSIRKTGGYNMQKFPNSIAFKIENEFDLHKKVVNFIRRFYPNAILTAGLGELQDTKEKRISSWQKGYTKGQPDIIIQNYHKKYSGFTIEFKTPLGCGTTSNAQEVLLENYKENGFKALISNDYDLILQEINLYMKDIRLKCAYCRRGFRNKDTLKNHHKYFHRIILERDLVVIPYLQE